MEPSSPQPETAPAGAGPGAAPRLSITNCHIHTFTAAHVPVGFAGLFGRLLRIAWIRRALLFVLGHVDPSPRDRLERYARILEVSHNRSQAEVFAIARGFYPQGTRFVVLPMDMELMGAGRARTPIDEQHAELARLRDSHPDVVVPFAAVDPRRPDVLERTRRLIEGSGFRGIKLYPPLGYHPNDPALGMIYAYAAERGIPVMAHCSRGGVHFRGAPTERMLTDPATGERLAGPDHAGVIAHLTDPDNYRPILAANPGLRVCLAHFGGSRDWESYIEDPWLAGSDERAKSWLAKIMDMLRSGSYPNLYTDVSYTVFADEEYVHLLKVLLSDERVRSRVLFGSDFYVVEDAKLEERRISVRVRSVLGEELFRTIAEQNPMRYLGEI